MSADREGDRDVQIVVHAVLAAATVISLIVAFSVVIPGLIRARNDGLLILAFLIAVGSLAGAFLFGRLLWRSAQHIGDEQ